MMHQYLRQKMISTIHSRLNSGEYLTFRRLFTEVNAKKMLGNRRKADKGRLYNRLWEAGSKGKKMSDVLNEFKIQGMGLIKPDIVSCVKDLRKHNRYHNCLEILEWMEADAKFSDRDQALRLGIIYNLKGIDEAEKYFDSLPPSAQTMPTYGALLNCYCSEKSIDTASALFEKMGELNYANFVAFNNMMGLYMKLGQPEKVAPLVQEMKQNNIQLTSYSYCVLIQSYGCLNDLEGVEKVANEAQLQNNTTGDWALYSSLAAVYVKAGQSKKAEAVVKKLEAFLDNNNADRAAYNHLISLCASLGNLDNVNRIWCKYKSRFKVCNNLSYLNMLYALLKLNDIEGMKKCLYEWESSCENYDVRLPVAVINACLKRGMVEEAEQILIYATEKAGEQTWNSHVAIVKYYLGKCQPDPALRHMELAIGKKWKQFRERVDLFFDYFMKQKDVDSAEKFYEILKKAKALDSAVYIGLLHTYSAAEKTAPEMRDRMEKDGVDIGIKHGQLLQKICPS